MSNDKTKFPERLRIRDTNLNDDLGGLGQRIYTTAGAGYEKLEYVRVDLYDRLEAREQELVESANESFGRWQASERALARRMEIQERLEAENAELRADAERYRWLREQVEKAHLVIAEVGGWDELESWCGDGLDEAIDLELRQRVEQERTEQ